MTYTKIRYCDYFKFKFLIPIVSVNYFPKGTDASDGSARHQVLPPGRDRHDQTGRRQRALQEGSGIEVSSELQIRVLLSHPN